MVNGAARAALPSYAVDELAIYVLIFAIGISDWPQFARVTRGATMVEKSKEYVAAAQVIGVHPLTIMFRHVLPNVMEIGRAHVELQSLMRISYAVFCLQK